MYPSHTTDFARAKLRFNLASGEVEIEGSEEFVERQTASLETIITVFKRQKLLSLETANKESDHESTVSPVTLTSPPDITSVKDENTLPDTFGEWIHRIPKDTNDVTKVLLAGYYIQRHSQEKSFRTRDTNKLLKDHGILVANPSQINKNNLERKRIFQVGKVGTEVCYRVSAQSEEELIKMITL